MKPVVVFRHAQCEGAGYFGTFLERHDIPWCEVRIDLGDPIPEDVNAFSGLVFMGGPMSANDDLPWISPSLRLINAAVDKDIPVLGHCLGGQLISKALGADVTQNPYVEIGWGEVNVLPTPEATRWFGNNEKFLAFHWHGETFSIPEGAHLLLSSAYCPHQAYAFGKHFAMQCHVEMTAEMVNTWCEVWKSQMVAGQDSPAVQSAETMCHGLVDKVGKLNKVAERIYAEWAKGLRF